uniref:gibberellin 2beta-dioxygenase n=1 Tax=Kalanchoe fedtschenkoi TaxID=63787 RepID=A0A7N0T3R5_KALFE
MVVSSQSVLDDSLSETGNPINNFKVGIPVIDLSRATQKALLFQACKEYGFFKVINHGIPTKLIEKLEQEAMRFFNLSQTEKEKAGHGHPFGYGSKRIGPNGDVGWIEYLLFSASQQYVSGRFTASLPVSFRKLLDAYIKEVKTLACNILERMAEGLELESKDVQSKMLQNEKNDSFFRINHYPTCPNLLKAQCGQNMIGFGEHTDPQIISVLRSNNTSGLQISGKDGNWISVPSDSNSFFINVGDTLQVLTNGRFKSVKHRVLADGRDSRLSMIYFAGPPLTEKIAPICSLMDDGEESLYKEFTWSEYKMSVFKSKLADNRLQIFEKTTTAALQ